MKITKEQYAQAIQAKQDAEKIIVKFHAEQRTEFAERMKSSPIFTDDELFYSAQSLCPCGHGLAYPKNAGAGHYWDCSAILKGIHDKSVKHTDQLPFAFYDVKGESAHRGTTRGVFRPKPQEVKP